MKAINTIFLFLLISAKQLSAQGCSDAGFCSAGHISNTDIDSTATHKNSVTFNLSTGIGDQGVLILTPAIQYENHINSKFSVQTKITANYANGNLGTAIGLGDVFIVSNYSNSKSSQSKSTITFGTKLPLNQSNLVKYGK